MNEFDEMADPISIGDCDYRGIVNVEQTECVFRTPSMPVSLGDVMVSNGRRFRILAVMRLPVGLTKVRVEKLVR